MREEVRWWLETSAGDLALARKALELGSHHHCAFLSQQAAEKALKALLLSRGRFERGHACTDLLAAAGSAGVEAPEELRSFCRELDHHYIASRYPNGVGGEPAKFYDARIAAASLARAEAVIRHVQANLGI